MTTSLYIQCIAMYILGQFIHLFLIKIPEYKKLWKTANEQFSMKKYWETDWNVVVGTLLIGIMLVIGVDQLLNLKPEVLKWVKWFFAGMGGFGSAIIVSKWSTAYKFITGIIDQKTNIADKKD